jgi:hypothetical protein
MGRSCQRLMQRKIEKYRCMYYVKLKFSWTGARQPVPYLTDYDTDKIGSSQEAAMGVCFPFVLYLTDDAVAYGRRRVNGCVCTIGWPIMTAGPVRNNRELYATHSLIDRKTLDQSFVVQAYYVLSEQEWRKYEWHRILSRAHLSR